MRTISQPWAGYVLVFGLLTQVMCDKNYQEPTMSFVQFSERFKHLSAMALNSKACGLWIGVFKLANGSKDHCETRLLKEALFLSQDNIMAYVWVLQYSNELSTQLQEDLLTSLTSVPFWLDHGGRFGTLRAEGHQELDHFEEENQMVWLVASFLIGEKFSAEGDKHDIIFDGIKDTSLGLLQTSRHRLWTWMDKKRLLGFKKLQSKTLQALLSLAALSKDPDLGTLAKMIVFLQLQDVESLYWEFELRSNRVDPMSQEDLTTLNWLLTGRGFEPKTLDFPTSLLLILASNRGMDLPPIFLDTVKVTPFQMSQNSLKSCLEFQAIAPDDCVYKFGEIGPSSLLKCLKMVGDSYKLWERHYHWQNDPTLNKILRSANDSTLEMLQDVQCRFSDFRHTWTKLHLHHNGSYLALWSQVPNPGGHQTISDSTPWTLLFRGNQSIVIEQNIPKLDLQVLPQIDSFRSTFFIIQNPRLTTSSMFHTGSTSAQINVHFHRAYANDQHWFVGEFNEHILAIYSFQPQNWTSLVTPRRTAKFVETSGSQNVWIVHVQKGGKFESFVEKVLSSRLAVHLNHKDAFHECLYVHRCLDSGPNRFLKCLRTDCYVDAFVDNSVLAACLANPKELKGIPTFDSLEIIHQIGRCLDGNLVDISVKWQLERTVFQLGWSEDLQVWQENNLVPMECEAEETSPANKRSIQRKNSASLDLDFSRLTYF